MQKELQFALSSDSYGNSRNIILSLQTSTTLINQYWAKYETKTGWLDKTVAKHYQIESTKTLSSLFKNWKEISSLISNH